MNTYKNIPVYIRVSNNIKNAWRNKDLERFFKKKKKVYYVWLFKHDVGDEKYYTPYRNFLKSTVIKAKNEARDIGCKPNQSKQIMKNIEITKGRLLF